METASTTTAQNLPPQPPPHPAPPPSRPSTKKRPFDSIADLQNSPYYKMRATVRDLRPHILEVLRTPDFRNCKAAEEIRQKMKIVMDLYKEMTAEISTHKRQNVSGETQDGSGKPPNERVFTRQPENKPRFSASISQNQKTEDSRPEGTFIVGGSAFGWNFVTFPGSDKSTYYGRTKESFRSANPKSEKNEVSSSPGSPGT